MSFFSGAWEGEDEVEVLLCLGFRKIPVATAAADAADDSVPLAFDPVRRGMLLGTAELAPFTSVDFGCLPSFVDLVFAPAGDCNVWRRSKQ